MAKKERESQHVHETDKARREAGLALRKDSEDVARHIRVVRSGGTKRVWKTLRAQIRFNGKSAGNYS